MSTSWVLIALSYQPTRTNTHHFSCFSFPSLIDVDIDEGKQLAEIPHRTAATENRHLREHYTQRQHDTHITEHPSYGLNNSNNQPTNDEISPSLQNRIDFMNTNSLSDENLMMAELGRNM